MVKRLLKQLLIPVLASRPVSAIASHYVGPGIPIFMLHRMVPDGSTSGGHTPSYLRQCLTYLKKHGYSFVSVEDILLHLKDGTPLPNKPVAFTIDDGFYDQATLAAPVFIELNCPATIFLISGFLDGDLWPWFSKVEFIIENSKIDIFEFESLNGKQKFSLVDKVNKSNTCNLIQEMIKQIPGELIPETLERLASVTQVSIPSLPPNDFKPMTWSMARELEHGGIQFGPHTVSHPILSMIDDEASHIEITQSWQRLKEELANPVRIFCYPNGRTCDFGKREIDIFRKHEFLGALSTIHAQVRPDHNSVNYIFGLPRLPLPETYVDFAMYCSWIENAKDKFRKNNYA